MSRGNSIENIFIPLDIHRMVYPIFFLVHYLKWIIENENTCSMIFESTMSEQLFTTILHDYIGMNVLLRVEFAKGRDINSYNNAQYSTINM